MNRWRARSVSLCRRKSSWKNVWAGGIDGDFTGGTRGGHRLGGGGECALGPDVGGVAVFADNGQVLSQAGMGAWAEPAQGGLPTERIHQIEYKDRLVYYAPITRTEVMVDDFNLVDERAAQPGTQTRLLGWGGLDGSRSATFKNQREAMPRGEDILVV